MRWIAVGLAVALAGTTVAREAASQGAATSPTPLSFARDRAAYQADLTEASDAEAKAAVQARWDAHLAWTQGVDRRAAAARVTADALTGACVDLGAVTGCGAPSGGWLTAPNAPPLFWQVQSGATDADGITGGIVFLKPDDGQLTPVAWAFEGASYDAPVVFDQDGVLYVAVPGITHGGRGDADVIFRWTPGADRPLQQVDSWSWRDDLAALLPGRSAYGRVRIDYVEQVALMELWREGDPGCCGTGGHALVDFTIADGRLKAVEAKLRDRDDAVFGFVMTTPADVIDWMNRSLQCEHWGGEEGYDADRRAQIAEAVAPLKCGALETDQTALEAKYVDNPDALAGIARITSRGD